VVGAPYSFKIQASGTDLSSWDISATPPGLDFDGGRIKGTPTKGGSFKFEVSVFDYTHDYLKSDSRDFTMLILDITTTGVPNGVANSSYTPTTFSAIGAVGTPAWTLSGGSLPAGMSFSSAGILDGTPTTAGTYPFSVTVKDQDVPPRSRAREFSLLVQNPTPLLSSLSPTSVVEGGSDFILTLTGSDFVPTSIVRWNGEDRPTFTLNSAQLTAAIPASDIATAGSASVTVSNSAPRGGVSVPLMLPVVVATAFARASLDSAGAEANRPNLLPAISADGRFIAFESEADNLVGGDQNRTADIFLRDTCATATPNCHPSTVRISSAIDGGDANGPSAHAAISADGRFVAFDSLASNLVANDFNQRADVFLRDTCHGAPKGCQPLTEKISSPSATEDADGASHHPSVSANGRLVAFVSAATNLTSGEPNPAEGVFLRGHVPRRRGGLPACHFRNFCCVRGNLAGYFPFGTFLIRRRSLCRLRVRVRTSIKQAGQNNPAARHLFRRRAGVPLQHRDCLNESGGGRRGGWRQLSAPRDRRRPIRCLFLEGDKPCTWRRLEGRSRACLFARYLPAFLGSVRSFDPNRIGRDAKSRP